MGHPGTETEAEARHAECRSARMTPPMLNLLRRVLKGRGGVCAAFETASTGARRNPAKAGVKIP